MMPATDPVSKICACQFDIPEGDFEFGVGNLGPPTAPGLASFGKGIIDAFIQAILFPLVPLNLILSADIPGLLSWINNAVSDLPQFFLDFFNLLVLQPFTAALQIFLPTFNLDLGIVQAPIPDVNPSLGTVEPWNTPMWSAQTSGFTELFKLFLLLPFNIVKGIVDVIIQNLSFPSVDKPFIDNIWSTLVVAGGFAPGSPAFDSVNKLGFCVTEQLEPLIPPAFPAGGATVPTPDLVVKQGASTINHEDTYSFVMTGVPVSFNVERSAGGTVDLDTIELSGADAGDFNLSLGGGLPFTLESGNPQFQINITFSPLSVGAKSANVVIYSSDPVEGAFVFKVEGTT